MSIFLDTSAFLAILDADAAEHHAARLSWEALLDEQRKLWSTSYVIVETCALLQARLGLEALRVFSQDFCPLLQIDWLGAAHHERAVASLLAAGRRRLSLVDCASFDSMRRNGIDCAFTLDRHFAEQGFRCVPSGNLRPATSG